MALECGDELFHKLSHLSERWNNRFQVELPYIKQYIDGNLSIVFELEVIGDSALEQYSILMHHHKRCIGMALQENPAIRGNNAWMLNAGGSLNGDQELMLVTEVQCMDSVQNSVPSLIRLKPSKFVDDIWSGLVYFSIFDRVLKCVGAFSEREVNIPDIFPPKRAADITSENIQT